MNQNELYEIRLQLLSILLHGGDISPVLSRIADREGNSMAVIDTSGKLLAHSEPFREKSFIWEQSIRDGFCPPPLIEHIQGVQRSQAVGPNEAAFVRFCEPFSIYYLCCRIMVGGRLYGDVFMLQKSKDFSEECLELLPFIAESLSISFERQKERRTMRERARGGLLADILSGAPETEIAARVRSGAFHFPALMRAVSVHAQYYLPEAELLDQVMPELVQSFQKARGILYEQAVVLVIGSSLGEEEEKSIEEKLLPVCRKWRLSAGISDPFSQISSLREEYQKVEHAISLAKRLQLNDIIHHYRHFRLYALLDQLPDNTEFSRFSHPALGILRQYDEEKHTAFYETLKAYTLAGFNQNQAAEALYLHRNTMNYRRQKLEELTGLNLEDPEERFLLRLSFALERFRA